MQLENIIFLKWKERINFKLLRMKNKNLINSLTYVTSNLQIIYLIKLTPHTSTIFQIP